MKSRTDKNSNTTLENFSAPMCNINYIIINHIWDKFFLDFIFSVPIYLFRHDFILTKKIFYLLCWNKEIQNRIFKVALNLPRLPCKVLNPYIRGNGKKPLKFHSENCKWNVPQDCVRVSSDDAELVGAHIGKMVKGFVQNLRIVLLRISKKSQIFITNILRSTYHRFTVPQISIPDCLLRSPSAHFFNRFIFQKVLDLE